MSVDIGPGATDRSSNLNYSFTLVDITNPANMDGIINYVELWFNIAGSGVKVGGFSDMDFGLPYLGCFSNITIGSVTAGSKQTFTGLSLSVNTGWYIGTYYSGGAIERDSTGGSSVYYKTGDHCFYESSGVSYTQLSSYAMSIYGTGVGYAPSVSTQACAVITLPTWQINGTIESIGSVKANRRGYVIKIGTTGDPTILDFDYSGYTDGSYDVGAFSFSRSLASNTHYRVRAYAANSEGTSYGSTVDLWTLIPPVVGTDTTTDISSVGCLANGHISDTGGVNCTRRGFCYKAGISGDPTTADSVVYDDGDWGVSNIQKWISGLSPNTNYRIRAYAVNPEYVGYGSTVQIITLSAVNYKTLNDSEILSDAVLKKAKLAKTQVVSLVSNVKKMVLRLVREIPSFIEVGSSAIDRGNYSTNAYTIIDLANPVNASGILNTMQFYFNNVNSNPTGVICGTFYGSDLSYTNRAYVAIGAVTKGSAQTFSGLFCEARIGDVIGVYYDTGGIETDVSGGSGIVQKSGNMFNAGTQAYTSGANYAISAYAYGLTTYNVGAVNRFPKTKKADSSSLISNALKKDSKTYVLGISMTEKFIRKGLRQFSGTITNGGSIKKVISAVKSQSISILGVLGRYYQRIMALETETLSDAVLARRGMVLIETISSSANLARVVIRNVIEAVMNDDSSHSVAIKILENDIITLTGYASRGYFLVVNSSIALSDSIKRICKAVKEQIIYMLMASEESKLLSSISQDAYISSTSTTWEQARLGDNLSIDRSVLLSYVTSMHKTGSNYMLGNSLLYFDTRYIPSDAELISAKVKIYSSYTTIVENFDIVIQNGQPTCPHVPAVLDDFYPSNYSGNGGSKSAISWIGTGWNEITLNATGLLWITKGGITKLSIMSSSMINDVQPVADYENIIAFYDCHDAGYEGSLPILEVEYRINGGGMRKAITTTKSDVVSILIQFAAYYPRVLSEIVQMSDGIVKKISAVRSDIESMLDSVARFASVAKSDSTSMIGKMEKSRALILLQMIGLIEAMTKSVSVVKRQIVSLTGIALKFISTAKTQSISISDKLVKKAMDVRVEAISITDHIKRAIAAVKLQTIINIGSMKKKLSRLLSGSIALSSSFKIGAFYSSVRSEIIQLSERITKRVVVTKTDVVIFVERASKSLFRQVGDSMNLVTFVFIPKLRILSENIFNTESIKKVIKKVGAYSISIVETFEAKQILRTFVIGLYRTLKFLGF